MSGHKKHDEIIEEEQKTLDRYRAEIAELKEKASQYSADVKEEFDKRLADLEAIYDEMQKSYASVKDKTGEKWEETKSFAKLTNKALIHSYHYFISHYRKK
jgi:DNA mismatch repair ATPase MutS